MINECADEYTRLNIEMIDSMLDKAYDEAHLITVWFWITMCMLIFEVISFCIAFITFKCCNDSSYDDYKRAGDDCVEMAETPKAEFYATPPKRDPEADFY